MIERDVTAGVHSWGTSLLQHMGIVIVFVRMHAAAALYSVTYFSEYARNIEQSYFSIVQVPSLCDLPFVSYSG